MKNEVVPPSSPYPVMSGELPQVSDTPGFFSDFYIQNLMNPLGDPCVKSPPSLNSVLEPQNHSQQKTITNVDIKMELIEVSEHEHSLEVNEEGMFICFL